MKKRMVGLLVVISMLSALTLGGCGKSNAGTDGDGEDKGTAKTQESENEITIWTFAEQHVNVYEYAAAEYKKEHPDVNIKIQLEPYESLFEKLLVWGESEGEGAPDLVDVEQGIFPYIMDGEMIFEPLNDYLEQDGIMDKVVESRYQLYAADGQYYGMEHSLCPVMMSYREDLFEEYNIAIPTTWEEYKAAAAKFAEHGIYMAASQDLSLGANSLSDISLLLRAGNADYVNEKGELELTDEFKELTQDIIDMQQNDLVYTYESEDEVWPAMGEDVIATYFAADWAVGRLRDNVPEQSGKWKLAPLPKVTPDATGISVNGGTGLCMVKYTDCEKDQLWDFMKFVQTDVDMVAKKYELAAMYPVVYEAMPLCNSEVEYLGNQNQGELYESMAEKVPAQYQAGWRGTFTDTFTSNAYDLVEGNISMDEFCNKLTEAVEAYEKE